MRLFVVHRIRQIEAILEAEPHIPAKVIHLRLNVSLPTVYRAISSVRRRKTNTILNNSAVYVR